MSYEVVFVARAIKDLRPIPRNHQGRIIEKAESLGVDPYPAGSLKLKGMKEELWRVRVGDYRILYAVDDSIKIVEIRRVGHRKDIY